jgi:Asp/Glu/hydantoin racemase
MKVWIVKEYRPITPESSFFGKTSTRGVFDNFEAANKCLIYYTVRDDQPKGIEITEEDVATEFTLDPFILDKI